MLDHQLIPIGCDVDGGAGHQLGIQGVELVRVRVRPQREPCSAPYEVKSLLEGLDHIHAGKTVSSPL